MREYSTPAVAASSGGNLTDSVMRNAESHPDRVAFSRRTAEGWVDVTAHAFLADVQSAAKGLLAAGIGAGDRVALLSRTRYEWTLLDYAIWFAGAVTVPVYPTSSADQVAWILQSSGATAVVVEDRDQRAKVAGIAEDRVWLLDEGALQSLTQKGAAVPDADLDARRMAVGPDDLATLVYTSGTTGRPKGCRLTHGNFAAELDAAVAELPELFDADGRTLLFLPLAHVFARIIQVGAVREGVRLAHLSDIRTLPQALQELRPTFLLAVPRVFEKLFNTASQRALSEGRGRAFDRAAQVAIAHSRASESARPGPVLRAQHALFERLVYARFREALGGSCRFAVSGGAPLGERLAHFFRGAGVPVLEGYGLTETTGAVSVNTPSALRVGSVGRPLPGTTLRVADDGELCVRGPQVFTGYWDDETATREVLTADGWLHTGDLAELDEEGFLRITGRKKEILVTAGGKNVVPGRLEDRVRAHPLVSHCMVVGDGRPYVAALVTVDPDAVRDWAQRHGKKGPVATLRHDPDLRAEVQSAVDEANAAVSRAEAIRHFEILTVDWSEETGELTPSLKLRRNVVMREFRREIAALYDR